MSNLNHETVADIVAEMKADNPVEYYPAEYGGGVIPNGTRELADRIEAAHKREREAGAEAAQICGEIGEMMGREAACHQPVTDCHGLNAAAMREALESVRNWCLNRLVNSSHQVTVEGLLSVVNAALSAPPRNCDVGTAEEQSDRLEAFCLRHNYCSSCPCKYTEKTSCSINWAQMPYEEGGAE